MFDPPGLAERVSGALHRLAEFLGIDVCDLGDDFVDPGSDDYSPEDYDLARAADDISLSLPHSEGEPIRLTYGALEAFVDEVTHSHLVDNEVCWTPRRVLVRVDAEDYESLRQLEVLCGTAYHSDVIAQAVFGEAENAQIRLVQGATIFGLLVVQSGDYEEDYLPPAQDLDFFLELTWEGPHSERRISDAIDSALFTLSMSFDLHLHRAPRPFFAPHEEGLPVPECAGRPILPIPVGRGLPEAMRLYNRACSTTDPEFKILGFVKTLEHVSEAVLREALTRAVQIKLQGPRSLTPDYRYVAELEAIITEHRSCRKNREALKLTLMECCDSLELRHSAPAFLAISKIGLDSKVNERRAVLESLAACLSATRNEIAHARASYLPTGDECPKEHLAPLAECARVAAGQAILWYAALHESLRVV